MIGRILGGRYEILEKIGEGGMAVVYKARCHLLNRYVAIKILKDEFIDDKDFNRKFKRESQAVASLSHPNILNIYDVGNELYKEKNYPYIVMEYIEGKTLKDLIREGGKFTVDETIYYGVQIAEAIKHAHSNKIIHRDIKPQNIMIARDNRVKVTDFGIARAATTSTLTTNSNVIGSVHYLSPEQARGGYTDERSDIYSLGIIFYEMVTGKLPYDGENMISVALKHVQDNIIPPRELDRSIPEKLESVILKCVQKNQDDRYANVNDLIVDLKNVDIYSNINSYINDEDDKYHTLVIPNFNTRNDGNNFDYIDKKNDKEPDPSLDENPKKPKNTKIILSAIGLALVLVTIVFYGIFSLKNIFKAEEIVVPNLLGVDYREGRQTIEDLELEFSIRSYVKSDEYGINEITYQSVEPNTKVKKGFIIEVTVSDGRELVRVPGIVNRTLYEAQEMLESIGLSVGNVNYKASDTTPKDEIMNQEPAANTYLEPGSTVNIIISEGEEIKPVIMPSLINENTIDAQNKILSLGLKIGDIDSEYHNTIAKDKVIWQSHEVGSELESNTVINLIISRGPEEIIEPEPDPDPDPDEEPTTNGENNNEDD